MYRDEIRGLREIDELRVKNIERDPKSVATEMVSLQQQIKQSQQAVEPSDYLEMKRRLSEVTRSLSEVRGQVQSLTAEKSRLQKRLADLKQSKSYRVGYQLGEPVRFLKKYLPKPDLGISNSKKQQDKPASDNHPSRTNVGISNTTVRNSDASREKVSIRQGKAVETELKRLWFQEGSISKSFELIDALDFKSFQSGALARLRQQIEGEYRLYHNSINLPPVGGSASFVQEPGRIMYCVHSTPVFNSNGYSTRTRGVAAGIAEELHNAVVVSRAGYPWDTSTDVQHPTPRRTVKSLDGVEYIHNPGPALGEIAMDHYFMVAADTFVREAKRVRPEVIQSASNHRTALPALIAARRVGVPFVYEVRGLWELSEASKKPGFAESERFKLMKELETIVCRNADKVLAITRQIADELINRGVDPEKIELVPNGVDPNRFLPFPKDEHFAKSRKISTEVPVVGFAGSLVDYEGLDLLIRASAKLTERGVKHQIAVAGSGPSEPGLKKLAKTLSKSNVVFLGRLPQNQIPRLLSTFDIVACPRKSHLVTELVSPLKPLEAFAAGKATVLSDVAPNKDLAGEYSTRAMLFEKDSVDSLADALESLINSPDKRLQLARAGRQWVTESRSWRSLGEIFRDTYREVKGRRISAEPVMGEKPLKAGVIADEFTRTTIAGTFDVTLLEPNEWRDQIADSKLDLIFVESAWEGNGGLWHRKVGYYSEDESKPLYDLLDVAASLGIPTVFWNKEDPVHFNRFANTAAKFDYVFTTDANLIEKYLKLPNNRIKNASSLPFFAQPEIHNPLVSQKKTDAFAYAGTYYGQRYASRSKALDILLAAAKKYGLEIFDRQANNPESPYQFPEEFKEYVKGALPYSEVVSSYAANLGHLNVSSVDNSPTMFSRRVVEVPACGGIVLSTPNRGIYESLGDNIAASDNFADLDTWMQAWKNDPVLRNNEVWRQMRTIYRSHTADTALSILTRTIGLKSSGLTLPSYELAVGVLKDSTAHEILRQSVHPSTVRVESVESGQTLLEEHGIEVVSHNQNRRASYSSAWVESAPRTFYEDLLLPTRFGEWASVVAFDSRSLFERTSAMFPLPPETDVSNLAEIGRLESQNFENGVSLGIVVEKTELETSPVIKQSSSKSVGPTKSMTVVVAGHDLKFAQGLIESLENEGHTVLIDKWAGHAKHDENRSRNLLAQADVIFCEWGLGNAVWYSKHVKKGQRLVVRVHLQEIQLPYLKKIDNKSVEKFIFVGELIRRTAILSHGIKGAKSVVVPNGVDVKRLNLPKESGSEFNIGFVGMIPQRKRLDLAISLVELLLENDPRYSLLVRGKQPSDYPWMQDRADEMSYYDAQFQRIAEINRKNPGAIQLFDFGDDMAEWYRKVGVVVSTSDYESFHFTIADGAASGAIPVSLSWPGADLIYPDEWLFPDVESMAQAILERKIDGDEASEFVRQEFNMPTVNAVLHSIITNQDQLPEL